MEKHNQRLDLLYKVGKKTGSILEVPKLLDQIMRLTQQTLRASASSVLLVDDGGRELHFQVAEGKAGKALRQMSLGVESGIAGWVACHGKPLIINNVTTDRRFNQDIDKATGFVTRSVLAVPLVLGRKVIGVIEVLNKVDGSGFNEQDLEVLVAIASTAAVAIDNDKLQQAVLGGYISTVKALAAAIDAKDPYTRGHSQRVMEYAFLGAVPLLFSAQELQAIEQGGILHDIGKIGIDDRILRKPAHLTPKEWSAMRNHPSIGANIIREVPFLETVGKLILYHHEKYDGTGYPEGLRAEDIPIGARLLAVADAFDTMTTDRAYRAALSVSDALNELRRCTGTQFCPVAVDAFISGFENRQEVLAQPSPQLLQSELTGGDSALS